MALENKLGKEFLKTGVNFSKYMVRLGAEVATTGAVTYFVSRNPKMAFLGAYTYGIMRLMFDGIEGIYEKKGRMHDMLSHLDD